MPSALMYWLKPYDAYGMSIMALRMMGSDAPFPIANCSECIAHLASNLDACPLEDSKARVF